MPSRGCVLREIALLIMPLLNLIVDFSVKIKPLKNKKAATFRVCRYHPRINGSGLQWMVRNPYQRKNYPAKDGLKTCC